MTRAKYKSWVIEHLFNKNNKLNPRAANLSWWQKRNKEKYFQDILDETSFLDENSKFAERIYCYINKITKKPKCKICNKKTKYNKQTKKYSIYCSNACVNADGNHLYKKKKKTSIDRYGHASDFSSKEHMEKANDTCQKKYNNKNYRNIKKSKETQIKKYGDLYVRTTEYKSKIKETCLKKYGESSWMKTDYYKNLFSLNSHNKKLTPEILDIILKEYSEGTPKQHLAEKLNISLSHMHKAVKMVGLDSDLPQNKINFQNNFISNGEIDLRNEIVNIFESDEIEFNVRNLIWPEEIDILNSTKRIGFEFNGTYWHSDFFKDKFYHSNKLDKLEKKGYRLINIFENVYNEKKDIIISSINSLKYSDILYARKMKIQECDYCEIKDFLNKNHIQGERTSRINFKVLDTEGHLVAVATFNDFKDGVELIRFASNRRIPGILNKILKQVPSNNIYSYANRCYTCRYDNIYLKSNFKEIDITYPNYFYVKGGITISRYKAMKHKLQNILTNFQEDLTEYENMINHGFHRVWDCGNILYKLNKV